MGNDNRTLTQLDTNQILRTAYDEDLEAQRVVIVAGTVPDVKVEVDPSSITNAIQAGLDSFSLKQQEVTKIEIPVIVKETVIERIEVPVIVKEVVIEKVEVPVIVKEIEYRELKVPFETVRLVEVEKPVVIKEQSIQILRESTTETKYLRIAVGCLLVLELITLLISRH